MTDLATALRHELDRLPRHDRARMVHARRLEPLLEQHTDIVDRLVMELAIATGRSEAVVRLSVGLGDPDGEKSRERGLKPDDRRQARPDRPASSETRATGLTIRTIEGRGGPTLSPERHAEQVQKIRDSIEGGRP